MSKNENLNTAARAKNDEFYTQFDDIQREMNCYYLYDENFLRGKTILLPCDDPEWSNFTKFFAINFELYGLKKLISTSYAADKKKFIYKPMKDLFDLDELQFDPTKDYYHGRIYTLEQADLEEGSRIVATNQCLWLTNIEHGRHKPLMLMNYADFNGKRMFKRLFIRHRR